MSKLASTAFPVADFIGQRWSPRAYSDRSVTTEQIGSLLEAARWSASCFNEQPWRFIVGQGTGETYDKLLSCLVPFNQGWAKTAPVLILNVATTRFERNGNENRHGGYDLGQAVGAMSAQATSMGLYLHQMAGFDVAAAREAFGIPGDADPLAVMTLGYVADPSDLDEETREKEMAPRERRALSQLAFKGSWGEAWNA